MLDMMMSYINQNEDDSLMKSSISYDLPCPETHDDNDEEEEVVLMRGTGKTAPEGGGTSVRVVWKRWSQRISHLFPANIKKQLSDLQQQQQQQCRPDNNGYEVVARTEKDRHQMEMMSYGHSFCKTFSNVNSNG
jgi:hypothetical protein